MNREQLLEAFRGYLESSELEETPAEAPDLHTLFTEMAALRNEVKTEARQFKNALEEFRGVFESLEETHQTLNQAVERSSADCHTRIRENLRGLLLDMVDLHDRLEAGLGALERYQPGFWEGMRKDRRLFIDSIKEGQAMTLRRLEQLLARHHVRPLEVLDQKLDPHTMKAVEIISNPAYEHGSVVEELRKGFTWEEGILRLAEVKVNKLPN
mgnify:CR=1 FL=1